MNFTAILHSLFDYHVLAILFSWFPRVHPDETVLRETSSELAGLDSDWQDVEHQIESMMNVFQHLALDSQESDSELLRSIATLRRANRLIRAQNRELRTFLADFRAVRRDLDRDARQMTAIFTEMQDAFSKLPEPVSAFPKAPGNGMHGPSNDSQRSR